MVGDVLQPQAGLFHPWPSCDLPGPPRPQAPVANRTETQPVAKEDETQNRDPGAQVDTGRRRVVSLRLPAAPPGRWGRGGHTCAGIRPGTAEPGSHSGSGLSRLRPAHGRLHWAHTVFKKKINKVG